MRSAIASGTRPGRRQWLIDERFARVSDKQTESLDWRCLVFWRVRMYRLSHPPVHVATSPTAGALEEQPACRLGARYSWRKPFLRRPPSTLVRTGEACAKK